MRKLYTDLNMFLWLEFLNILILSFFVSDYHNEYIWAKENKKNSFEKFQTKNKLKAQVVVSSNVQIKQSSSLIKRN